MSLELFVGLIGLINKRTCLVIDKRTKQVSLLLGLIIYIVVDITILIP